MSRLDNLKKDLRSYGNGESVVVLQRFFKTGKGQYGEGDKFIAVSVPNCRKVAKMYKDLSLTEIEELLGSAIHEERLVALLILVEQFNQAIKQKDREIQKNIYEFYLEHTKFINNWDLVDLTASRIVGRYLLDKDRSILEKLATSSDLWKKRIAMISTFEFIYNKQHEDALHIAEVLLQDRHDLIQKAVGWMLREVGKRVDQKYLLDFLDKHYKTMPRTALRYSIERLSPVLKAKYMTK